MKLAVCGKADCLTNPFPRTSGINRILTSLSPHMENSIVFYRKQCCNVFRSFVCVFVFLCGEGVVAFVLT